MKRLLTVIALITTVFTTVFTTASVVRTATAEALPVAERQAPPDTEKKPSGEMVGAAASALTQPQLYITDLSSLTPEDLVQRIVTSGVTVSNVSYRGTQTSAGTFTGGSGIVGFSSGILLSSGSVHNAVGPNTSGSISRGNGLAGDTALDGLIPGYRTYDATVLEFNVVPDAEILTFQFVFGSDEYNEWVNSSFNDVFGFFVNGQNIALVPGSTQPVSINNINSGENAQYFRNNTDGSINTEMDGLTAVLSVQAYVNKHEVNRVKLAIADAGDSAYDSNVFIRSVKAVEPPKVEVTRLNNTGDTWYDDTFLPGELNWLDVAVYLPQGSVPDTARVYVDGEMVDEVDAAYSFSISWQAPPEKIAHAVRVDVTDTAGETYSGQISLYALVSATGSVLSYLPTNSVRDEDLDMDISPFHEDDLDPASPILSLETHVARNLFRQINTVTLEGKSDGTTFVEKPRVKSEFQDTKSWFCDDPLIGRDATSYVFPPPPLDEAFNGASLTVEQQMKSMVNAYAPDIWNATFVDPMEWVFEKAGLPSPMPPRNAFTGGNPNVPPIFSTVHAEIWAGGLALADWADEKNSVFPYHYAYLNGELQGGARHYPRLDLAEWAATVPYMEMVKNGQARLPKFPWPLKYLNQFSVDDLALYMAKTWFKGLRAECARGRLESLNKEAYDALHENFPAFSPRHFDPAWLPYRTDLWPHLYPEELAAGAPYPATRTAECTVPGCPGTEKRLWFITWYSPVQAHLYDEAGRHTGRRPDGSMAMEIPGVFFQEIGHLTFLILPESPAYRVEFEGYETGTVTMNMTQFDGREKLQTRQFYNLPVTAASRGTVQVGGTEPVVRYDENGTGEMADLTPTMIAVSPADDATDALAPTTTPTVSGTAGEPGYFRSPVTLSFTATDDLSGVEQTEYTLDGGQTWDRYGLPATIEEDGAYTVLFRSVDYQGNVEPAGQQNVVVDTAPPTVTFTGDGTYDVDQTVTVTCTASDSLSGLATDPCADPLVSAPAYALGLGEQTYTTTATDRAGNSTTASATVTVIVSPASLCTVTKQFVTQEGIAQTLCLRLDLARAATERADQGEGDGQIRGYMQEVAELNSKFLDPEHAAILRTLAEALLQQP